MRVRPTLHIAGMNIYHLHVDVICNTANIKNIIFLHAIFFLGFCLIFFLLDISSFQIDTILIFASWLNSGILFVFCVYLSVTCRLCWSHNKVLRSLCRHLIRWNKLVGSDAKEKFNVNMQNAQREISNRREISWQQTCELFYIFLKKTGLKY